MALCYNLTPVLNILGFDAFVSAVTKALLSPQNIPAIVMDPILRATKPLRAQIASILFPSLVGQSPLRTDSDQILERRQMTRRARS